MRTLYVTDLDGTLLNSKGVLTDSAAGTLNRLISEGMNLTVATARSQVSAERILQDVRLPVPAILMNGAVLYDLGEKKYEKICSLSARAFSSACGLLDRGGLSSLVYAVREGELMTYCVGKPTDGMARYMEDRSEKFGIRFERLSDFSHLTREGVIYFTAIGNGERLAHLPASAEKAGLSAAFYRDVYSRDDWYLELFSHEASKGGGVAELKRTLGFCDCTVFGDNRNDLSMFAVADRKYAVENADDTVLASADERIPSNDSDGVTRTLSALWDEPVLETERMKLYRMSERDFSAVHRMLKDPEVMYAWEHGFSAEETHAWIARRIEGYRKTGYSYYLARDKATGSAVGQFGLLDEELLGIQCLGVGWITAKSEWGKGYAAEAGRALINYAFSDGKTKRVAADIRPENTASRRVAEKLGMTVCGEYEKDVSGKRMTHLVYERKK